MEKKIRVALFGYSHPHAMALLGAFEAYPDDFEILGYADVPPYDSMPKEKKKAKNLGKKASLYREYEDYHDLLDLAPDLAAVTSDNRSRGDICTEILSRGIPVIDEKPMAMDYADALRMVKAAKENHTFILCNWPIAWFPAFREAKRLADAGRIGKVMRVTYRSPATWGPFSYGKDGILPPKEELGESWWYRNERGGGSILDYACYGTVLATWIFGKRPISVSAVKKNFCVPTLDVEDYSAALLDFGDGVGLLEGSWSTFNPGEVPSGPVIHGTEGVIVCDRHTKELKIYEGRSHTPVPPTEILDLGDVRAATLLGAHLIDVMRHGAAPDPMLSADLNLSVVAVLDAVAHAAETGTVVKVEQ